MMSAAKVFIFAPADPTAEMHQMLADQGCELIPNEASWDTPYGNNEAETARMAEGCDALAGTSIHSSPITRSITERLDKLRRLDQLNASYVKAPRAVTAAHGLGALPFLPEHLRL
jgi:hypothetical protein